MAPTDTQQDRAAIRERLAQQIRDYMREQRGVEVQDIDESTHFKDDLDLDSLDLAALAVDWENEYGVTLDDEHVITCTTVAKAVDLVQWISRSG
jgi:acyl carrier protein